MDTDMELDDNNKLIEPEDILRNGEYEDILPSEVELEEDNISTNEDEETSTDFEREMALTTQRRIWTLQCNTRGSHASV